MTSIKFRALTHNDHRLFFEAIGEHGKDFQNIQQYMAQKCGKTNNKSTDQSKSTDAQERKDQDKKEDDKKREQIRNFYNKLYTKLSQLIGKLDDRVEKVNQELYLLINYGEIWKKHNFNKFKFNNKTKRLLEELVHQGYTTLRYKNKNVRLRTPPCKALKKINEIGIDEKVKVVTSRELPKDVIVEFLPAINRDWLKVQSMSQNPRVRAKLSIQKRIFSIIEFLENKWNISPDKLNRTVDAWLKVPPNNLSLDDIRQHCPPNNITSHSVSSSGGHTLRQENSNVSNTNGNSSESVPSNNRPLLRLKPSAQHELKEVNITRVVPDNHLDLSLNAYIKRICESKSNKQATTAKSNDIVNSFTYSIPQSSQNQPTEITALSEHLEISQGAMSTSSRLPISLTTPDSSIVLERSLTSDQPGIAQARHQLNKLHSLAVSFEGCENSRTACEDTQDRNLSMQIMNDQGRPVSGFGHRVVTFAGVDSARSSSISNIMVNNDIPALIDEDAAIDTNLSSMAGRDNLAHDRQTSSVSMQHNSDSQNSKSIDFPRIPKNVTLGDYFKMYGQTASGDDANDSFTVNKTDEKFQETDDLIKVEPERLDDSTEIHKNEENHYSAVSGNGSSLIKPHNHMIEIKKLAEGWTRQDESTITVGELYLAFKCPEKIVLEYTFEQSNSIQPVSENQVSCPEDSGQRTDGNISGGAPAPENNANESIMIKLLTAASLSLAHIERQKQEQQLKLHDQPGSKLKRRKGPSNPNTIRYLKRDDPNMNSSIQRPAASGQQVEIDGSNQNLFGHHNQTSDNNNYLSTNNDKSGQSHIMTQLDIEATNQRVEEALKQLQPTRLSVFRRR